MFEKRLLLAFFVHFAFCLFLDSGQALAAECSSAVFCSNCCSSGSDCDDECIGDNAFGGDSCGAYGECNELCSDTNICNSNSTCDTQCFSSNTSGEGGSGEIVGWSNCFEGSPIICTDACENSNHCNASAPATRACYTSGANQSNCAESGNLNQDDCSIKCNASSNCEIGATAWCWKDGEQINCGSAGELCVDACSEKCDDTVPCHSGNTDDECWSSSGNKTYCGPAQESCLETCDNGFCDYAKACTTECWVSGGTTTCGDTGNYCAEDCRVKCNLNAPCEDAVDPGADGILDTDDDIIDESLTCWFDQEDTHYCSEFVGEELGFTCGTCGSLCEWDSPCDTHCMMLGVNLENGSTTDEWNAGTDPGPDGTLGTEDDIFEDTFPVNNDSDVTGTEYFMTTCHDFGKCEQCAQICQRQTPLMSVSENNGFWQVKAGDVTGFPASGAVKMGAQLVTYISHSNGIDGEGNFEGTLFLPLNHPDVMASGPVHPLNVLSSVHQSVIQGSMEIALADTRAFPDSGTLKLNPNCGPKQGECSLDNECNEGYMCLEGYCRNCNEETAEYSAVVRGAPGIIQLVNPLQVPHNNGEMVVLWKTSYPSSNSRCDLPCGDGNKPSTCGAYGMCQTCSELCHEEQSCTEQCWWNGKGYEGEDINLTFNWLKTCGSYALPALSDGMGDDNACKKCETAEGVRTSLCDSCVAENIEDCAKQCLTWDGENLSTCSGEGYGPQCHSICSANDACDKPCRIDSEGSSCGAYQLANGDDDNQYCRLCTDVVEWDAVCGISDLCNTSCFFEGSTTCAGAILGGAPINVTCANNPTFNGQAPVPLSPGIGGVVSNCGPEPQGNCGCELQWQGADSYAECGRQGTEAIGDTEAGIDGTWWVAGRLHKDDQFFRAGVLIQLYLMGDLIFGSTNDTAVFHGTNAPDLSVVNEPPSTSHLFFKVEPSLKDCPADNGEAGEMSSGLFFRWRSDIFPVTRFGLCSHIKFPDSDGEFLDWGLEGLPGFFLPWQNEGSSPLKGIHLGLSMNKLIDASNLLHFDADFTLPHIPLDLGSGLPRFEMWDASIAAPDLSLWAAGFPNTTSVNLSGWNLAGFGLTEIFTGGNNCHHGYTPSDNCETGFNYRLPKINMPKVKFDQIDLLMDLPHLEDLLRLNENSAINFITNVDVNSLGWPDFSMHPYFNGFSFKTDCAENDSACLKKSGLTFRLPDFRTGFVQPEFFRTFPQLHGVYKNILQWSPPQLGAAFDEQLFSGMADACALRVLLVKMGGYIEQYRQVANDYPGLVNQFKILMMAFVNARAIDDGVAIKDSPFVETLYDYQTDATLDSDFTERYRLPGSNGNLNDVDAPAFVANLRAELMLWGQQGEYEDICPEANSFGSVWASLNNIFTGLNGSIDFRLGWPAHGANIDNYWSEQDGSDLEGINVYRLLPDIKGVFDVNICGDVDLSDCFDITTGRYTDTGARKFLAYLRNVWNMRNIANRRSLNTLLASMTVPGAGGLTLNDFGMPNFNLPSQTFDKLLSASSFACSLLAPQPHENNDDAWNGDDPMNENGSGVTQGGGMDEELTFTRVYTMLGQTYGIELKAGLKTGYQLRGSMSPSFITSDADASAGMEVEVNIKLTGLNFYGITISIGVIIDGEVANAEVNGNFFSGWDRAKINVDMIGNMELRGPDIDIAGYVSVSIPIIGGGTWTSPSSSLMNLGVLRVPLFNIHHTRENPMVALFDKFEMPPSVCSLSNTEDLDDDDAIITDDLVEDPIYVSPCDGGDNPDGLITNESPDFVCTESPDPMHAPPDPLCTPNPQTGEINWRLVYDPNSDQAVGSCFDQNGYPGCDYSAAMVPEACDEGMVCDEGYCVAATFDNGVCVDPCSFEQSTYCQKCQCAGGSEGHNPCTAPPSFCEDSLTLIRGQTPGLCSIMTYLCDGLGIDQNNNFISALTVCAPGTNDCGTGGSCVVNPDGGDVICDFVWENINCGAIGKKCVEAQTDCNGEDCDAKCVMCEDDEDCGLTGSGWTCSDEGNCVNTGSVECYTDTDCDDNALQCVDNECVADDVPPDTFITNGPPEYVQPGATVTFTFNCQDNVFCGEEYFCRLNDESWEYCNSGSHSLVNISDAEHVFQVKAKDSTSWDPSPAQWHFSGEEEGCADHSDCLLPNLECAQETCVADVTMPSSTIFSGPSSQTPATLASFQFQCQDNVGCASIQCRLDDGEFADCDLPNSDNNNGGSEGNGNGGMGGDSMTDNKTYTGLSVGAHVFQVRSVDTSGNVDGSSNDEYTSWSWTVISNDDNYPAPNITDGPENLTAETSAIFVFEVSAEVNNGFFVCALDDGTFDLCESPQTYTNVSSGEHIFLVRYHANDGNANQFPVTTYSWQMDNIPPEAIIYDGPESGTLDDDVTFLFNCEDPPFGQACSDFLCQLDNGPIENPCGTFDEQSENYEKTYNELDDGPHQLRVWATDALDQTGLLPAVWSWSMGEDDQPTEVTITAGPRNPTAALDAVFQFEVDTTVQGGVFMCALGNDIPVACTSPYDLDEELESGFYCFNVYYDSEGDGSGIGSATGTTIGAGAGAIEGAMEGEIEGEVEGAGDADGTSDGDDDGDADGAGDGDGHHGSGTTATTEYCWTIDTEAPIPSILSGPPQRTTSTTAIFELNCVDNIFCASFECVLSEDGVPGEAHPCGEGTQSMHTYTDLSVAAYTFQVFAIDSVGNKTAANDAVKHIWEIEASNDLQYEEVSILSKPLALWNGDNSTFEFEGENQLLDGVFACSLDGADFSPCVSPKEYDSLMEGPHEFSVVYYAESGGQMASQAELEMIPNTTAYWTIDITLPTVDITSGPDAVTDSSDVTFTFVCNDLNGCMHFSCSLDGINYEDCGTSGNQSYANLIPGSYTFHVYGVDNAKNNGTPETWQWVVTESESTDAGQGSGTVDGNTFDSGSSDGTTEGSGDDPVVDSGSGDGAAEGTGDDSFVDSGSSDGTTEGSGDDSVVDSGSGDGTSEGSGDDSVVDSGSGDGTTDGAVVDSGSSDGTSEGTADGAALDSGNVDGQTDGTADGTTDSASDGSTDGSSEGDDDGWQKGSERCWRLA